jgi:hypothetical protein
VLLTISGPKHAPPPSRQAPRRSRPPFGGDAHPDEGYEQGLKRLAFQRLKSQPNAGFHPKGGRSRRPFCLRVFMGDEDIERSSNIYIRR